VLWVLLTAASSQEEKFEVPHIQEVQLVDLAARRAAHTDRQIQMGVYSFAITTDLSFSSSVIWTHFLATRSWLSGMFRSLSLPFASFLVFQAAVSEWPVCDAVRFLNDTRRFITLTVSSVPLVFAGHVDDIVRHYFPPCTALRGTVIIANS
jgi:hypothetical protein